MNDLRDFDIDHKNPRKGGLHGAVATKEDLTVCMVVGIVSVLVLAPLLVGDFLWAIVWATICIGVNWFYNFPPQLSRVPVLDMVCPCGYLLIIPFGSKVMGLPHWSGTMSLPRWPLTYIVLLVFRTQLWLQLMDIDEDRAAGKRTTAVAAGRQLAAFCVFGILLVEIVVSGFWPCLATQLWSAYSACVLALELKQGNKRLTMGLMFLGGLIFSVPCMRCL